MLQSFISRLYNRSYESDSNSMLFGLTLACVLVTVALFLLFAKTSFTEVYEAEGVFHPSKQENLSFKSSGILRTNVIVEGKRFEKGETIASIQVTSSERNGNSIRYLEEIKAPFSGYVVDGSFDRSSSLFVDQHSNFVTFISADSPVVRVKVSSRWAGRIVPGQKALIRKIGEIEEEIGKIEKVVLLRDPKHDLIEQIAVVRLDRALGVYQMGSRARVKIVADRATFLNYFLRSLGRAS